MFYRSFCKPCKKRTFFFIEILIFIQHTPDHKMRILVFFIYFNQNVKDKLPDIRISRHGFFLQTVSQDEAAAKLLLLHLQHR